MTRRYFALATLLIGLTTLDGHAAIIQTFTSQSDFIAQIPVPNSDTTSFGTVGPGPLINLVGPASSVGAGLLQVSADSGMVYGGGTVLSTDTDRAVLVLSFSQPLHAIGLKGFISDAAFNPVSGSLFVDVVGSGGLTVAVTTGSPPFIGLVSDVDFSRLEISVDSFDQDITSVAFATLTETTYMAVTPRTSIPAPGWISLLMPAAMLLLLRRPRQPLGLHRGFS